MASFNKVILLGNLTRDPEMKFLPSGTPVAEFGLAMNRKWMDQTTKEAREAVTFVDCKAMGRQAEVLSQHTRKGSPLFVEGRLDYRQWEGPDGTKRSKLEVFVENFQFVGPPRDQQGGGEGAAPAFRAPRPARASSGTRSVESPAAEEAFGGGEGGPREDVPF
jgi:single-strand DNA-binding protein